MKVMVTGAQGQLGRSLGYAARADAVLTMCAADALDITDRDAVMNMVRAVRPDVLFNAAAYTAVDRAEVEEERALAVNATAVGYLAEAAQSVGARLIHVSTDYVFDGRSGEPYRPGAAPNPLCAYGRTKLAGEAAAGADALIVRTSWLYAPQCPNFVRTMLHLMARRGEVRVVADQIATPTFAPGLAAALWALAEQDISGIYHYSDSGAASWYDFAVAIQEEAVAVGILAACGPVTPIGTADFPTPARRPAYSVLHKGATEALLGGPAPHWRVQLRAMIQAIKADG